MKKVIVILFILLCLSGCYHTDYMSTTIKHDELVNKFENKETFVMYASNETCVSCKDYRVNVDEFCEKYKVTIYCFYCDDFESEEVKDIKYNYLYYLIDTPTTYVIKEGKVVDYYEGTLTKELLYQIFKKYDLF